jgi:peptide/nickel transport system substrate-binding protein
MQRLLQSTRRIGAVAFIAAGLTGVAYGAAGVNPARVDHAAASPKPGGTLTLALSAGWDVLDPAATAFTFARQIMQFIYDPLLRRDPKTGRIVPGLVQSYTVSKDQKTVRLHLRRGVKFQDGTPFNAHAVVFSFNRILNPKLKSPWAASITGPVSRFKSVGESTVIVRLKAPFAPFLDSLTQVALAPVSPAAVAKYGSTFGAHPVGTGPFMFQSGVPNDNVVLVRNPNYKWAPGYYSHQGAAYLSKVVIRDVPESATRMALISTNGVDVVYNPDVTQIPAYSKNPKYKIVVGVQSGMPRSIVLNNSKFPFNDARVRLAVAYAVDKKAILKAAYNNIGSVANNILSPSVFSYSSAVAKAFPKYDPAKAKQILAAAGWTPGKGGTLEKNGQELKFDYGSITGGTNFVIQDQIIQSNLKAIGISMNIQSEEQAAYLADLRAGKWSMAGMLFVATDPDVLYTVLSSQSIGPAWNTSFFRNKQVDALLVKGRETTDDAARAKIYEQIQEIVAKQVPYIPYYNISNPFIVTAKAKQFKIDRQGFWDIYDTYLSS